jgi:homoserine dehydrogenase
LEEGERVEVKIGLSGFGNVGRNFIGLLLEKKKYLKDKYKLDLKVVTVLVSDGGINNPQGIPLEKFAAIKTAFERKNMLGFDDRLTGEEAIKASNADVWVEATPTNIKTGQPGLTYFHTAFDRGMHVVTLSKGPLVCAFDQVMEHARKAGVQIKYSGATAAALPTIDVALNSLAGTNILSIQGILNGTSNFILTAMEKASLSFAEALAEAKAQGIAEPDPSLDVEGWDTASKMIIIANSIYDTDFKIDQVKLTGITKITPADLQEAKNRGGTIKLLGIAEPIGDTFRLEVAPTFLRADHPLASVNGTTKGIYFCTDTMGPLTVIGGYSNPKGAAAAALKDIISIFAPAAKTFSTSF